VTTSAVAGNNTISYGKGESYAEIDAIDVA
jgi:hypothetical protein